MTSTGVWFYLPNLGAAILFTILFGFICCGIIYHAFHGGSRAFTCVVIIGLTFEVVGFTIRAVARHHLNAVPLFATPLSLIVLAPLFVAAGNYVVMSRIIGTVSSKGSRTRVLWIPAKLITPIFVTCDIVTILIQVSGTSIAASSNWVGQQLKIGSDILIAGLAIQAVTVGFFLCIGVKFGGRQLLALRPEQEHYQGLKSIVISSIFIEARCIYRLIEFATGIYGYLFAHEWNFYLFEATPMVIATGVFVWWYPPHYIPTSTSRNEAGEDMEIRTKLEQPSDESGA